MTQPTLSIAAPAETVQRLPGAALAGARHEDWRYTSLQPAIDISRRWLAAGAERTPGDGLAAAIERITSSIDANWLVIANGAVVDSDFPASAGIDVEQRSDTTTPLAPDHPLADLSCALLQDNLRLTLHAATEEPLGLLIIDDAAPGASVSQTAIDITVMPGCDVEIIEYQTSAGDGDHYANSVISLHVGQTASTRYVRLQDRRIGHVQTGRLAVRMGKDSQLDMAGFDLGGGLIRNDVAVDLNAPGASATVNGLYLAGDGQHIDNHTRVDHRVGPATSSQEYRGILNGRCQCVWNGKAVVHEGADGTDASQANHNLLLSENAEIDTKPELEIYAEDVKCSHGTTVGQLDENAIFYLRTRGFDRRQAKQVLTRAFAADLVQRSPVAASREAVSALVAARLADLIQDELS